MLSQGVALGYRIALKVKPGTDLDSLLKGRPVKIAREVQKELVILQAANSAAAIDEAERWAKQPGVIASYPVMRRAARRHGRYANRPNDPYWLKQWHPENRTTNAVLKGLDLNARTAWSVTRGEGVLVAVADDGVELRHPALTQRAQGQPHFNFDTYTPDGSPETTNATHGTAVAGVVAAEGDNKFDPPLAPDLSFWDERLARISFPAAPNRTYQIRTSTNMNRPFTVLTNIAGRLPEFEFVVPCLGHPRQWFQAGLMPAP